METQSEKRISQILNSIIIWVYPLSFILLLFAEIFNTSISVWIKDHLFIYGVSSIILMLATLIGLIKTSDVINLKFTDIILFIAQFVLSLNTSSIRSNIGSGISLLLILLSPTLIYLLRSYFNRLHRIENMIEEIRDNMPVENWIDK